MARQQMFGTTRIIYSGFPGAAARELHIQCWPTAGQEGTVARQAASMYEALASFLRAENGTLGDLVQEVVFFRNISRDFECLQKARLEAFHATGGLSPCMPAATFVGQAPLDAQADFFSISLAMLPHKRSNALPGPTLSASTRLFLIGDRRQFFAGSICGAPGSPFDESFSMFCAAERLLLQEGMDFRDVARTWIYLRHMERDYAEFNRARREFFRQRKVSRLPASTGIHGIPFPDRANFLLSLYANQSSGPVDALVMTTPTLNEASAYGSDFSRGLRIADGNKVALYISGTASVDENGQTAHPNDFAGQAQRMLLNVEALLTAQKASFQDVLSAVTYLKNPECASAFRKILQDRGHADIPNVLVHAAICRPDLLCEMEAIAALPLPDGVA